MLAFRFRVGALGIGMGLLAEQLGFGSLWITGTAVVVVVVGYLFHRYCAVIAGIGLITGVFWASVAVLDSRTVVLEPPPQETTLQGVVVSVRQAPRGSRQITLSVEGRQHSNPRAALVLSPNAVSVSDRIQVRCRWRGVDDQWQCFSRDITHLPSLKPSWSWVGAASLVHARIQGILAQALPEPEGSIATAMVFGYTDGLPPSIKDQFRLTGTSYLLVASGMQVVLTIFALEWGMLWLGVSRRRRTLLLLPMIVGLLVVIGLSPSSIRGAVMGYLPVLSLTMGRGRMGLHTLLVSALGMAVLSPTVLTQMNFQLSFLATAGILLLAPVFERSMAQTLPEQWAQEFATTLGATLATLPVVVVAFGIPNPSIVVANLLLVSIVSPMMMLTMILTLLGVFSPSLAAVPAVTLTVLVWIVEGVIRWSALLIAGYPRGSAVFGLLVMAFALLPLGIRLYGVYRSRIRIPAMA
ncbi:ComEC/Rec2 family competence protein [Candidatus Uhrbacteria bacterium]|nr:ComEC/Rec2 family competence protein [Candidatus Uhrbacteria bacterium]